MYFLEKHQRATKKLLGTSAREWELPHCKVHSHLNLCHPRHVSQLGWVTTLKNDCKKGICGTPMGAVSHGLLHACLNLGDYIPPTTISDRMPRKAPGGESRVGSITNPRLIWQSLLQPWVRTGKSSSHANPATAQRCVEKLVIQSSQVSAEPEAVKRCSH